MPRSCPHCKSWLPTDEAACPNCRQELNATPAKSSAEVPDKETVVGNSLEHATIALALLLVMAGMGYAFVQSLGENETALSVVFGSVFLGCGAVLYGTVRNLIGWLRAR